MERKPNLSGYSPAAAELHAGLSRFIEEHGVPGWNEQPEDVDNHMPLVGRNMQGHVYGKNGWMFFNVAEVIDSDDIELFENQIDPEPGPMITVGFQHTWERTEPEHIETYLVSAKQVAKVANSEALTLYMLEEFEVEALLNDLRGLVEGNVTGIFDE